MTSTEPKLVCLGIITGVHGIHGEVVIKSYTEAPLDIKSYGPLHDESRNRQFEITKARIASKGIVARLKGIDDRTRAEGLKGTELYVEHARLPEPEDEDEFYFTDLIDLEVFLTDDSKYGAVTGVHNFGAGDLIEIMPLASKQSEIYPFTKETIPDINLPKKRITLNPPEIIEVDEKKN